MYFCIPRKNSAVLQQDLLFSSWELELSVPPNGWWGNCGTRELTIGPVNIFSMPLKMFFSVKVLPTKRTPKEALWLNSKMYKL